MEGQETNAKESLKFFDISIKHPKPFLLFDQIKKIRCGDLSAR